MRAMPFAWSSRRRAGRRAELSGQSPFRLLESLTICERRVGDDRGVERACLNWAPMRHSLRIV